MPTYSTIFAAALPIFGVMMIGWAVRRLNWLTEAADASLLRLAVNVLFPALI